MTKRYKQIRTEIKEMEAKLTALESKIDRIPGFAACVVVSGVGTLCLIAVIFALAAV